MDVTGLGLPDRDAVVYDALLSAPATRPLAVKELRDRLGFDPRKSLEALATRGLIDEMTDDRFMLLPPAATFEAELAEQRRRLAHAESAVANVVERYRAGVLSGESGGLVEMVEGIENITCRVLALQRAVTSTLDTFVTGHYTAVGPDNTEEQDIARRGVQIRVVLDRGFLLSDDAAHNVDQSLARGVSVRTAGHVPGKLLVHDGQVAIIPLSGHGTEGNPCLFLRGGLATLAQELFNQVWASGREYTSRQDGLDSTDVQILRLLLIGMTDAAVGTQLGLSMRTVQRRIQRLMQDADVTTRIQLGWHAREHHWV